MLISARESARRLLAVGIGRSQSDRVLAAGLAGDPVVTRVAILYDGDLVDELCARQPVDEALVDELCPHGLFVSRRFVDARADRREQYATLEVGWGFSTLTAVWLRGRILQHGSVPLVSTVGGFVVCGAEVVDTLPHEGRRRLELTEPGTWFDELKGHIVETGPGQEWSIRGWQFGDGRVGRSARQLRPKGPQGYRSDPAARSPSMSRATRPNVATSDGRRSGS